jgi:hypothetical protein
LNTACYYFDFCWVANFIFAFSAWCLVVEIAFERLNARFPALALPALHFATRHPRLGATVGMLATGPLGGSVVALGNSLVLHDLTNYASLFIHMWPAWTMLCLRLNREAVFQAYPGHFEAFSPASATAAGDLLSLAAAAYGAWWVVFTVWMLCLGRFLGPGPDGAGGYDTVYRNMMMHNKVAASLCGVRTPADICSALAVVKYMLLHAGASALAFVFSAACQCLPPHVLHLPFCVFLLAVATWNGARKYNLLLTGSEVEELRAFITEHYPGVDLPAPAKMKKP